VKSSAAGVAGNSTAWSQNPFNTTSAEHSFSGLDIPRQWTVLFTEELPFFKEQHGLAGHMFGGWVFSANYILASGQRYTPVQNGAEAFGTAAGDYYDAGFLGALWALIQPVRSWQHESAANRRRYLCRRCLCHL